MVREKDAGRAQGKRLKQTASRSVLLPKNFRRVYRHDYKTESLGGINGGVLAYGASRMSNLLVRSLYLSFIHAVPPLPWIMRAQFRNAFAVKRIEPNPGVSCIE